MLSPRSLVKGVIAFSDTTGERVLNPWSTPGVSGVATDRESKHPVHFVPKCAPPNRQGTERDREIAEIMGHPGSMQEGSPNRAEDVPHDLPIREPSPGGSHGTLSRLEVVTDFRRPDAVRLRTIVEFHYTFAGYPIPLPRSFVWSIEQMLGPDAGGNR